MNSASKKYKTHILILDDDNPERELAFEIEFQRSLTAAERYEIMESLVKDALEITDRNGYQDTPSIVARA